MKDILKIQIIGSGSVGLATGDGLSRFDHEVIFQDISIPRLYFLQEMGFSVTSEIQTDYEINFVCVPEDKVRSVIKAYRGKELLVIRSTVPIGTTTELSKTHGLHICHNPEFLREAIALHDFLNPYRIVIGECCEEHGDILEALYKPFNCPIIRVGPKTSEACKLIANAHLSTLISFWNEARWLCDKWKINSHVVGRIAALDPRISEYGAHRHGRSFGGSCLPKDLDALIKEYDKLELDPYLLCAVKQINKEMENQ